MKYYDPVKLQESKETLSHKLHVLNETQTKCSTEDLQGKYKKAYERLKTEIQTLWIDVTVNQPTDVVLSPSTKDDAQNCWDKYKKTIRNALYSEYNLDKALALFDAFKMDVVTECNALLEYKVSIDEMAELEHNV